MEKNKENEVKSVHRFYESRLLKPITFLSLKKGDFILFTDLANEDGHNIFIISETLPKPITTVPKELKEYLLKIIFPIKLAWSEFIEITNSYAIGDTVKSKVNEIYSTVESINDRGNVPITKYNIDGNRTGLGYSHHLIKKPKEIKNIEDLIVIIADIPKLFKKGYSDISFNIFPLDKEKNRNCSYLILFNKCVTINSLEKMFLESASNLKYETKSFKEKYSFEKCSINKCGVLIREN